ncbi:Mph(E)/Mph(G) family macrolide 2'-phosphotransferase [Arthrospiribacter ruber]|uniref:Mph(E)/Mph(G) family macrolide 2'-phosphotransferase n=1 Tax=Arthrospiribacter ruber TaxID=2487934 RepID=A0A951M808_9BACT|nr:Mph(E)/Mph(G) family macrolide 2'-phosphotransferase [Arthrospiribacter ruber]MBW3467036.1 Mph(E)/Mph(G) family macrolide 2'-phosphotransferase [Arthrospiribacter ruber]
MTNDEIHNLAERHGLMLSGKIQFNEMGIDFKVCFAMDKEGNQWLLRIPRRSDLGEQIRKEKLILQLVHRYLTVQVPDWKIATDELVAYPLLKGKPALTYDAVTYKVTWNMAKSSPHYITSLAKSLVELHAIPKDETSKMNLKMESAESLKLEIHDRLKIVKSEIGISNELENRYNKWLDNDKLWPNFTKFIHGDLYAGHILTYKNGEVCGIIDWTTAQVSDIAIDFSGHLTVFGEESLRHLIAEYEKQGGEIWNGVFEQSAERAAASPLAYGFFAIETQDENHIQAAKIQLGVA